MIYELAEIEVKEGQGDAFAAAVEKALPLFRGSKGCHGVRLTRSLEHPYRFRLLVEWETVEDHMEGFRHSPQFNDWRALVSPYFANSPRVEHLETLMVC